MKKLITGTLIAAIILLSPGFGCYEAVASEINGPGSGENAPIVTPRVEINTPLSPIQTGVVQPVNLEAANLPTLGAGVAGANITANASVSASAKPVAAAASASASASAKPVDALSASAQVEAHAALPAAAAESAKGAAANQIAAVKNGETSAAFSNEKNEKTGILARIFDKMRWKKGAEAAPVAGAESSASETLAKPTAAAPAQAANVPAPAKADEAKPTRWQRFKKNFSLSEYNDSEQSYIKGQMVFLMALSIYIASLPLFVQALTGSAEMTGQARLVHFWTLAFASLFSGKVVQKLGMIKVLRGGSTMRAVIYGAIGVLSLMHVLPWALFVGLVGLNALVVAHTTLTDMDEGGPGAIMDSEHKIEKSGYMYDTLFNAAMMILPPLVGLGMDGISHFFGEGIGPKVAFVVFSVVMLAAVQMYSKVKVVRDESKKALLGFWQTVKLIKNNAAIRTRWLMATLENFIEDALFSVVLPVYALEMLHLHGFGNGLLLSGKMAGGLLAGAAMTRFAIPMQKKMGAYKFLVGLTILASVAFIPTAGLWLYPTLWLALPVAMLMKFLYQPIRSRMRALLQVAIRNDAVAKDHPTEVFSLMNFTGLLAAGAGGLIFERLFELSKPGKVLFNLFGMGPMAPMIILTAFLAGMSVVYLIGLGWMKKQMTAPVGKSFPGYKEGSEQEAIAKLEMNLKRIGAGEYKTQVVEEALSDDRPTSVILSPASPYKLSIAREGGRQSPGDVLLALDPTWLIQETTQDGKGAQLRIKKGVTFDKDGSATLVEYKHPRKVRYFANFYTLGGNDRDDGVAYEKDLDVPQSNSLQLEKTTNDKLLTRKMLAAKGVAVPATIAFLMAAHPLIGKANAFLGTPRVQFAEMPEQRQVVERYVKTFLSEMDGPEVVVKPSGPQYHSARGVKFFQRGDVDGIVDHVLALKKDPMMTQDGAILVDERLMPPPLYLRTGDYQDGETWGVISPNRVGLNILSKDQVDPAKPHETKDWNVRVLAARAPWGKGITTGMFVRAATYGKPTTAEPENPADAAVIINMEQLVDSLRKGEGLLKTDEEAQQFLEDLKKLGADAIDSLAAAEKTREREHGGPRQDQTDYIGLDVMVVRENGKLVPKIIEVNDHDAGGQWQLDQFYPADSGASSREWVATMLARARRDAMRGKRIVVVGSGYPNKKFFLETARQLGVEVVLVAPGLTGFAKLKDWVRVNVFKKPSQDNWARGEVSQFIPVDTTKAEGALAEAVKKLKKAGALNGITTYWEDDVVLTAEIAEALGLPYHSVKTAKTARNKSATRDAMKEIDPIAKRDIASRKDMEAAVADPKFPFPSVLKPAMGAEAQFTGVVSREDALRVYDESLKGMEESHDTIFQQSHNFVLEEYLGGNEWDANIVMQNGALLAGSVTDNTEIRDDKKVLKEGEKRQINMKSTGAALPSVALSEKQQKEALEFAAKAVRALGGSDGVFHVEGKTSDRPRLLEVNLRPGGAYVVHWNKAVTGIDEAEMLFAIAAGVPAVPFQAQKPLRHLKGVFVFSDREGVVKRIGLKPEAEEAGIKVLVEKKPGAKVDFKDNDRVAMISASGRNAKEVDEKLGADAKAHLDLHVEEQPEVATASLWSRFVGYLASLLPRR